MSRRAARFFCIAISAATLSMVTLVGLRVQMFKLSYDIEQKDRQVRSEYEALRTLRYAVAEQKALARLKRSSETAGVHLNQPLQVNHIVSVESPLPHGLDVPSLSWPERLLGAFSFVPDALAETKER